MRIDINNIGIIGAGQMGLGIAHVCAASKKNVTLIDIDDSALEKAMSTIDSNLSRLASRGKISQKEKKSNFKKNFHRHFIQKLRRL